MNRELSKEEETLRATLTLLAIGLLIMWLGSMVPDQDWMFDKTPVCSTGKEPVMEGKRMMCRPEG